MATPDIALQTAVRSVLVLALAELVEPSAIRAGTIRPASFPAVILGTPSTDILGRAGGAHLAAELDMLLHLWTADDDAELAQRIGGAVLSALVDAPKGDGLWFDTWTRPRLTWIADPRREALYGAVALSCIARWRQ